MLCIVTPGLCPPRTGQLETTSQPHLLLPSVPAAQQQVLSVGQSCPGTVAQVDSALRSRQWRQAGPKEDLILQGAAGPLAPWSQDPQMASCTCSSRLASNITSYK